MCLSVVLMSEQNKACLSYSALAASRDDACLTRSDLSASHI